MRPYFSVFLDWRGWILIVACNAAAASAAAAAAATAAAITATVVLPLLLLLLLLLLQMQRLMRHIKVLFLIIRPSLRDSLGASLFFCRLAHFV